MKQLIVPVAIIVALIAFFVIIDSKEFSRHDDVQTVQSESPTSNRKTTVSVPESKPVTETKPVETKPVAETKPVTEAKLETEAQPKTETKSAETKPVAETKLAEAKPVEETKNVEVKPVAETKPVETTPAEVKPVETKPKEKAKPAAVSVVTEEEAEKLNEFAIFLSTVKTTIVEGEITERSELPDPQKSDYPNCRFTAHFKGNTIKTGESCPKEIMLIIEGFKDSIILDSDLLVSGDKIECSIIPFEELPVEEQSTQLADDLNSFLLERFYVVSFRKIKSYEDNEYMPNSGIFFSDGNNDYISIFERHINPMLSQKVDDAQKEAIKNDLKQMNELLKGYNENDFDRINKMFDVSWKKEKDKDQFGHNRVTTEEGTLVWRNIDNSFWCLPENYIFLSKPDKLTSETLNAFASLKKACESNGVQFIVSLVSDKYVVSSRVINSEFSSIPDIQTATFIKQLSEIGVECIYSFDEIVRNYNRYPFAYIFPTDSHPSDTTQDVITDLLAERLKRFSFEPELDSSLFFEEQVKAYPDLAVYPHNCDIGNNKEGEVYFYRKVYCKDKTSNQNTSNIMIIGNSFSNIPLNATPSLLMYKIRKYVEVYRLNAYGPFTEMIVQILSNPFFFLKEKKVLIMQIGTNHLQYANSRNIMIDISHADSNRILINGKSMITHFLSQEDNPSDRVSLGALSISQKNVFKIDNSDTPFVLLPLDKESSIDIQRPFVCLIPSILSSSSFCELIVNGQRKKMIKTQNGKWYNLCFNLPAGTREITIRAEGTPGTTFAVKDIQIWQ